MFTSGLILCPTTFGKYRMIKRILFLVFRNYTEISKIQNKRRIKRSEFYKMRGDRPVGTTEDSTGNCTGHGKNREWDGCQRLCISGKSRVLYPVDLFRSQLSPRRQNIKVL